MIRLHDPAPEDGADRAALDDPRVAAGVEEYLAALEAGQAPGRAEFLARYPENVAAAIAKCLDGLELVRAGGAGLQPAPPEPPPTLGDFRLIREVGRGGMGIVYEAEQISLRRRVALKVLSLAGGLDVRQLQRFRTEAQAAAGLHHTHIAPVYAVGQERGVHYYAMQFIDGPSLAQVIASRRQEGGLPVPLHDRRTVTAAPPAPGTSEGADTVYRPLQTLDATPAPPTRPNAQPLTEPAAGAAAWRAAARLGIEAAQALDYAHQQGIVHRDVKPANLLLDAAGHLWVVDFGLARLQSDSGLTTTGDVVGTLRYMSPEQARAGQAVIDHRADVYGLGVTLYELLTLTPAFPGDDRQDLHRRVAEEEPPPRLLAPDIPADLQVIVLKAMAKEPSERYATACDFADDLRRLLEDRPIVARRPSLAQRARRWARRHRSVAISVCAAAALFFVGLLLGLLAYAQVQGERAREQGKARVESEFARHDAEVKKKEAEAQLYDALLESAHGVRLARRPGYRAVVWEKLHRAADLRVPGKDSEAIAAEVVACLGDPIGLDPVAEPDAARLPRPKLPGDFDAWYRPPEGALRPVATPDGNFVATANHATVYLYGPTGLMSVPSQGNPGKMEMQAILNPTWAQRLNSKAESPLGGVYDLEFARDGTHLAAGCEGGLAIWRLFGVKMEGVWRYTLLLHSLIRCGNVTAVALHPEGKLVATASREVRLWSFPDGRPIAALPLPAGVSRVEFSADGQMLLAVGASGPVIGWPIGDTPEKRRMFGQRGAGIPASGFSFFGDRNGVGVPGVAFSPDGRALASVSKDVTVRLWDPGTGQQSQAGCGGHNAAIEAVAFSPDGRLLATADFEGGVILHDAADGHEVARLTDPYLQPADRSGPPGQVWRVQFDAAGEQLAAGGGKGVVVWSLRRGEWGLEVRRRAVLPGQEVYDVAFHPNGSSLAYLAKTKDNHARLYRYDLGAAEPRVLPVTVRLQVRGLNFDPPGRLLTFVTPQATLARWDWDTEALVPSGSLTAFQWAPAPGGRWAATAGPDNSVALCDLDGGTRLLALPPEESEVWCLAWSPDGQRLALGLSDGSISLWDLAQVRDRLDDFGVRIPSMRPPPR